MFMKKEARFHIDFVRIQPFEDGNKRTARIITNYNLCRQNRAPVIIKGTETEEYFNFINEYDTDGFSNYLKKKSQEEFEEMLLLYELLNGDCLDHKNNEIIFEQVNKIASGISNDLKKEDIQKIKK